MRKSKRECERKREIDKYLYMNVRISDIMYDSYEENRKIEAGRKKERKRARERAIGHAKWSSTVRCLTQWKRYIIYI